MTSKALGDSARAHTHSTDLGAVSPRGTSPSPYDAADVTTPIRYLLIACGWIAFGLGIVGLFLPVLPTTPFMLLAAACFWKSSERLHRYIVEHPRFGQAVNDYLEGRGITRRTKVVALTMLWLSVLGSVIFFVHPLWGDVVVLAVATGVTGYLLWLPTRPAPCRPRA